MPRRCTTAIVERQCPPPRSPAQCDARTKWMTCDHARCSSNPQHSEKFSQGDQDDRPDHQVGARRSWAILTEWKNLMSHNGEHWQLVSVRHLGSLRSLKSVHNITLRGPIVRCPTLRATHLSGPPPFAAPPFGPPTLRALHPSGPQPFGPPTLRGPTFFGFGTLSSQNSTSQNWPKSKLADKANRT